MDSSSFPGQGWTLTLSFEYLSAETIILLVDRKWINTTDDLMVPKCVCSGLETFTYIRFTVYFVVYIEVCHLIFLFDLQNLPWTILLFSLYPSPPPLSSASFFPFLLSVVLRADISPHDKSRNPEGGKLAAILVSKFKRMTEEDGRRMGGRVGGNWGPECERDVQRCLTYCNEPQ